MKIIIILIFCNFIFAQDGVIVSFEQYLNGTEIKTGTYIKDTNNSLDFYVGSWEGIWDNKKVTLTFSKKEKVGNSNSYDYNYYDKIVGKFIFRNLATNEIILDTSNVNNYDDFPVISIGVPENNNISMSFRMPNSLCILFVDFLLKKVPNNPNQLKYKFMGIGDLIAKQGCTYDSSNLHLIPVPFPRNLTTELILNKI